MIADFDIYTQQFTDIIRSGLAQISTIKPSEWAEQHVVMGKPRPGNLRYEYTPYTREIIDCLSPDHPARIVAIQKGAQVGLSASVIMPGLGWMIVNNPGNTYLMVGAADLVEKAVEKLDLVIDSSGIRQYIKPQVLRNRANKSGDTNSKKDFSGGYISIGSANNHKAIAQVDLQYIFLDDLDAMKGQSVESGNLIDLVEQRAAAYKNIYKMFLISTPLMKETSLVEPAYLLGDQRKYFVECPCCHEPVLIKWNVTENEIINNLTEEKAKCNGGLVWDLDAHDKVVEKSVGYVCYKCGGYFQDKDKHEMLNGGQWIATANPSRSGYFSYHLSSLYAPVGMFDWAHYVTKYIEANPNGQPRNEAKCKTFVNTCLGETYEQKGEETKANDLQKNIRNYDIGTVPEKMSISDGNGVIMFLTCAADLNGVVDDARLDYEVVAWSESGASYSVTHGSIGTFVPRENSMTKKADRERWSYEHNAQNSVWRELEKILATKFMKDDGRSMSILLTGIDTGHYTQHAYSFIDRTNHLVVGLKGKDVEKYVRLGTDLPAFRPAKERGKLYLVEVNQVKDKLSELMKLKWDSGNDDEQPPYFMNYPIPSDGKYLLTNYFSHFESEHRVPEVKNGQTLSIRWVKKTSVSQNHFWDVRVYNYVLKEIWVHMFCVESKQKRMTWEEFVDLVMKRK